MNITKQDLVNMGCDPQEAEDWLIVRKSKKKPLTPTALKRMITEAEKAGLTLAEAVKTCAEEGWQGFKACYMDNRQRDARNAVSASLRNVHNTDW